MSDCPIWTYSGNSSGRGSDFDSDCVIKPVNIYKNPLEKNSYLILCEELDTKEKPYDTNIRAWLRNLLGNDKVKNKKVWIGYEQEYVFLKDGKILGWLDDKPVDNLYSGNIYDNTSPTREISPYYCGRNVGENIAREHMNACIEAGVKICGINAEGMLGQWEYQIGPGNPIQMADDLWIARGLMEKICDKYNITVSLDPKPSKVNKNPEESRPSDCHINISTEDMRSENGVSNINSAIEILEKKHHRDIKLFGTKNDERFKYINNRSSDFSWGIMKRSVSVRIPWQVAKDGKGYLEDRRPSANCDPYLVVWRLIKTICMEI